MRPKQTNLNVCYLHMRVSSCAAKIAAGGLFTQYVHHNLVYAMQRVLRWELDSVPVRVRARGNNAQILFKDRKGNGIRPLQQQQQVRSSSCEP